MNTIIVLTLSLVSLPDPFEEPPKNSFRNVPKQRGDGWLEPRALWAVILAAATTWLLPTRLPARATVFAVLLATRKMAIKSGKRNM